MSVATTPSVSAERKVPEEPFPYPNVTLIESDGIPLETHWHVLQIGFLLSLIASVFRQRTDFYAGGNMFIYFNEEQARNRDYRGPDFFFVDGVNREPMRPYWAVWAENGRYPDFIIELLSPTTAEGDRTVKKDIYERTFHTHEYCCYDPETRLLEGWRLGGKRNRYQPIQPNERGWLWIEMVDMWLGVWQGPYLGREHTWLRFYHADGSLVLLSDEAAEQRAETAEQRAETAEQRAETAEREAAQLRARLAELEGKQ